MNTKYQRTQDHDVVTKTIVVFGHNPVVFGHEVLGMHQIVFYNLPGSSVGEVAG